MSAHRPGPLLRRVLRAPTALYDHDLGWLFGHRLLRLTHSGRRSGRPYETVLEVIGIDRPSREVFVLVGFGTDSDWYRNIQARPPTEVVVGRARFRPAFRVLDDDEAADVVADYERDNWWMTPIVRRGFSWLAGWRYDGSSAARHRLVQQLPVVGFRPEDAASPTGAGADPVREPHEAHH